MFTIARATAQELLRNKILLFIILFSLCFILLSLFLAGISLGQNSKILIDFGAAMMEIFGLVTILFFGSQLIFKEIEGKTIYLLLTKPIARSEFFLGKFFGFSFVLGTIIFIQSLVYFALLYINNIAFPAHILASVFFIFLTLLTTLGVLFLFASFSSPILVLLLTIGVFVSSHALADIIDLFSYKKLTHLVTIFQIFYAIFPPFEALNLKAILDTSKEISQNYLWINTFYALAYTSVMLFLGVKVFETKSFEK